MSHQNLLEMDELNQAAPSSAHRESPKRLPRPLPRSKIPRLGSSSKKERVIDDVMSLSSDGTSPQQEKRNVAFTSSFDNNAFLMDETHAAGALGSKGNFVSRQDKVSRHQPQPVQRQKSQPGPVGTSAFSKERSLSKGKSFEGTGLDESDHLNDNIPSIGDNPMNRTFDIEDDDDDDDDDGNHSSATFTIENEKQRDAPKVTANKPPIPKPKRRGPSDLPKPQQRKSVRMESTSAEEPFQSDDSGRRSPSSSKRRKDHEVVDVEPDIPTNEGKNDNEKVEVNETDTVSVSSAAAPKKQSVKSRFGKLFASSSSSDSKAKRPSAETEKVSAGVSGESASAKDKPSIVNRWKKTFSRSSSKPVQEEDEDAENTECKAKGESEENPQETEASKTPEPKKKLGKRQDTRIFMPEESNSEEEEHSLRSEKKEGKTIEKGKSIEKLSDEEKGEVAEEKKKEKKSKFKPFAKLIVSKSKEKVKEEQSEPEKVETEPEQVAKDKSRKGKKEKAATQRKQEEDSARHRSHSRDDAKFISDSSLSEDDDEVGSVAESASSHKPATGKEESKKESKRKKTARQREVVPCIDSASGKDLLFGVTIHSSDLLPLDPNVIHPVIKVSVMCQNGQYLRRSTRDDDKHLRDRASSEGKERKSDKKGKRSSRRNLEIQDEVSTANAVESVLPIMSQPCRARQSIPTFAPTWNELLVFEEPFKRFATPAEDKEEKDTETEPILFFEIMDFLPMNNNGNATSISGFHGSDTGWYKVAWAFLKPIGANGILNLNKKLRLQLYKPVKLRSKEKYPGPEVYSWWKSSHREKLNCTLYVTPKGILPPETKSASLRQLLSMRKEQLTQAILDSQLAATKTKERRSRKSLYELREYANWTRMEGQSCKPPNKLVASLPSSQIESLNIVISGNVHCTKFSPCGNMLAAGLDTDELHVVLLFKVPSWTLLKSLKGHHGIIYEIAWKIFELDDENACHYLATASADSTVRIWSMKNCDEKNLSLTKVLYHPSYVYAVKFHPTHPSLLATGCYDFVIRIWDVKPNHVDSDLKVGKKKHNKKEAGMRDHVSPIILLDQHSSFVNCLAFDATGNHLFSGDGSSCIFKWSCSSPSKKKSWRLEKDVKLHHGNVPVNCINVHPAGNRLLVHLRDNFLKILDVVTLIPLQTFSGLHNERFQIRSCFSPCGNLVMSGSEDGTFCIWDADTGKILQLTSPQNHPHCIVSCTDYHPFDYYMAVGLMSTISEPSPVLVYFYDQPKRMNYPMLKKTAMKMRQSLEKSRSQSMQSFEKDETAGASRARGQYSAKRGDSTEKFVSIIQKLDTALYFAQQRNKKRQSEAEMSACTSTSAFQFERKSDSGNTKGTISSGGQNETSSSEQRERSVETEEYRTKSSHYIKRQPERPKSASSAARTKRERFRTSLQNRDAKSDSEQAYKLKVTSTEVFDNQVVNAVMQMEVKGKAALDDMEESAPIQVQSRPQPVKRRSISHSNENLENNNVS